MKYLAHSATPFAPKGQGLAEHLRNVSQKAEAFMIHPLLRQLAALNGLYHDAGKYKREFQRYLREASRERVDHATLGGQLLAGLIAKLPSAYVAGPIFGHHGGLPNAVHAEHRRTVEERLTDPLPGEAVEAFYEELPQAKDVGALQPLSLEPSSQATFPFELFMAARMVYSALVDADFLDTEEHFDPEQATLRGKRPLLADLLPRYQAYIEGLPATGSKVMQGIRGEILADCLAAAEKPQGLFSLTVPTGGGKTLSSLGFALRHAKSHPNIRRVIYAIPFTSIIEQNAEVFREAVGEDAVLEHHSAVAPPEEGAPSDRASENWDAPLVVTTNVQLFESLFSNKPSKCRKLHNLQDSIIILDEMQALPDAVLRPCLLALQSLALNYRATVIICTATQPNYDQVWEGPPKVTEIIPNPDRLFEAMRRTRIVPLGALEDEALVARLAANKQVLCIVNNRAQAQALHQVLGGETQGAYHLSTFMCAQHRSQKLADIRSRLKKGKQVCVVSTSLIEAGVDVDFPVVYRAAAGLDAIAQAAGRCNRNGFTVEPAPVYVFQSASTKVPPETERLGNMTLLEIAPIYEDWLSKEALRHYFSLRFGAGANLDTKGIVREIAEHRDAKFSYETIADNFQVIASGGEALFIPFDEEAKALISRLERGERLTSTLRRLQRYSVSIYEQHKKELMEKGCLRQVAGALVLDASEAQMKALYTDEYGLNAGAALTTLLC